MRHDPIFTAWLVRCPSPEEARRLENFLADRIAPDATVEDVIRACPGGVETQRVERHRLGDYFEDVRLLPGPPDSPGAFRVLFQRRPDAGRFWKDLIVRILRSVRQTCSAATTTLDYKGDENLVAASQEDG